MEECNAKIEQCNAKIKQATADTADANKYIGKLLKDRDAFSKEFDSRSAMRSQEMAATQAALDALQEVTAGAKSAVEGFFLQKSASLGVKCKRCGVAAKRLRAVGRKYHERSLVQLAASLENRLHSTARDPAAYFDPSAMDPVKNLLHQLITRLEDELAAETSHHDWCQTEKATSAAAKAEREQNIESLTAEIESLTTAIQQLTSDITFLNGELIRIQSETDTAIRLRKDEKETFLKAKADHEEVIAALNKAMSALSAQYGFLQIKHKTSLQHKQSPFSEYSSGGASD